MNISRLFASNIIWRGTYLFTSLVLTVMMSRYLQAEVTGALFYFISLLTLILIVVSFSMESSITYFVSSGKISNGKMQSFALVYTFIVSIIFIPVSFLLFGAEHVFADESRVILYAVLFVAGNLLTTFYNALYTANGNFFTPNLIFIILNSSLIILLLLSDNKIIETSGRHFIFLFFLSQFIQGLLVAIVYGRKYVVPFSSGFPGLENIRTIIIYSGLAYIANLVFFLVTRLDYWLIEWYVKNDALLGNYIQASRLVQLFQMLPVILAAAIFPVAAAGHVTHMKESILKLSRIVISAYGMIVLILVASGQWLFPFVFGESFNSMYQVFLLLIPGLLALTMLALLSPFFAAVNRLSVNVVSSLVGLTVIVPVNLWLIPLLGIRGAAIASSAGYIGAFLYSFIQFRKESGAGIHQMLFVRTADIQFLKNILGKL